MKININIQLDCDNDFGVLGDFQFEIKRAIKENILRTIMARKEIEIYVERSINEVLGELKCQKK